MINLSRLQKILDEQNKLKKVENKVVINTNEVFKSIKDNFSNLGEHVNEFIDVITNSNQVIEIEISGKVIGCAIVDGTGLIKDNKILNASEDKLRQYKMTNLKNKVFSDEFGKFFTGLIVMYTKIDVNSYLGLSRFYVNKDKDIIYRTDIGWSKTEWSNEENLSLNLNDWIISSIEDALFELESFWNETNKEFNSLSELTNGKRIGFTE